MTAPHRANAMILFGWSTRSFVTAHTRAYCPVCRINQVCGAVRKRLWLTAYFIPLLPLGGTSEELVCSQCGTGFAPDPLEHQYNTDVGIGSSTWPATSKRPDEILPAEHPLQGPAYTSAGKPQAARVRIPSILSSLSIVSLIFGFLSPILLLGCFTSLLSAPVAIASGHFALRNINRSAGRLHGRWQALTGLTLGYSTFILTLVAIGLVINSLRNLDPLTPPEVAHSSAEQLTKAEIILITSRGDGVAFGNSKQAQQLASQLWLQLQDAREELRLQSGERKSQLPKKPFLTYCELHAKSCAFIVQIPSDSDYTDKAEDLLIRSSWQYAHTLASDHLNAGDSLAVGLRGRFLYDAVLTGRISEMQNYYRHGERDDLITFFHPNSPAEEVPPEPAETDEDSATARMKPSP